MKGNNLALKLKPYLMLFPVLFILSSIFIAGILMGLLQSLGYFKAVGLTEITLAYYKEVLQSQGFFESLQFSLYTAFVSSCIAVILGVLLSYAILQLKGKSPWVEKIYKLPIAVPHLVAALLVYNILAQTGILPRFFYGAGLIQDQGQFPSILYEKNGWGIILAYVWKEIPFVTLITYTILKNVSSQLSNVAANLGAIKRQIFFHVTLPLIMPSIFTAFIIIFAFSFGAYEIPFLLGPTQPKAIPVQAFVEYSNPVLQNRPYAMVMNMLITAIALILTWLYFKAFERLSKFTR